MRSSSKICFGSFSVEGIFNLSEARGQWGIGSLDESQKHAEENRNRIFPV